jgi:ferredoxin
MVFIPGYVGFGLYLAAIFLLLKGYHVIGITGFGMPHNWTTLIPPYSKKIEARINVEIGSAAESFTRDILSGKRIYRRIVDLVVTLLIFPLPVLFLLFGHLFLAKTMFAGSSCNGCGLCAANCPRQAIRMYGKKRRRPYWTYRCEQCMRCAGYCPKKAVDCNSFLVLSYMLLFTAVPLELLIANTLRKLLPIAAFPGYAVVSFILYYISALFLGALIYVIFYLLGKITPVGRLFTILSFTHYWRKYRQADVSVKTLTNGTAKAAHHPLDRA